MSNRKQRRNANKQSAGVKAQMLQSKITEHKVSAVKAATIHTTLNYATEVFMTIFALTLRDELGFGEVRVKRVLNRVEEKFDNVLAGYVNLEDMKEVVKEELNIVITARESGINE